MLGARSSIEPHSPRPQPEVRAGCGQVAHAARARGTGREAGRPAARGGCARVAARALRPGSPRPISHPVPHQSNVQPATLVPCLRRYYGSAVTGGAILLAGVAFFGAEGLLELAAGMMFAGVITARGFRDGFRERVRTRVAFDTETARREEPRSVMLTRLAAAALWTVLVFVGTVAVYWRSATSRPAAMTRGPWPAGEPLARASPYPSPVTSPRGDFVSRYGRTGAGWVS